MCNQGENISIVILKKEISLYKISVLAIKSQKYYILHIEEDKIIQRNLVIYSYVE